MQNTETREIHAITREQHDDLAADGWPTRHTPDDQDIVVVPPAVFEAQLGAFAPKPLPPGWMDWAPPTADQLRHQATTKARARARRKAATATRRAQRRAG